MQRHPGSFCTRSLCLPVSLPLADKAHTTVKWPGKDFRKDFGTMKPPVFELDQDLSSCKGRGLRVGLTCLQPLQRREKARSTKRVSIRWSVNSVPEVFVKLSRVSWTKHWSKPRLITSRMKRSKYSKLLWIWSQKILLSLLLPASLTLSISSVQTQGQWGSEPQCVNISRAPGRIHDESRFNQ